MNYRSRKKRIEVFVAETRRLDETIEFATDVARIAPEGSHARQVALEAAKAVNKLRSLGTVIDLSIEAEEPSVPMDESTPVARKRA